MKTIRYACLLVIQCVRFSLIAQTTPIVKYFDSYWMPSKKTVAVYFTQFIKEDSFYRCTSYYMKSKKVYAFSTYADTLLVKQIGLMRRYYETGQLQDSSIAFENGSIKETYRYYENGHLFVHYLKKQNGKELIEGYDEKGKKIPDFIYMREAIFEDGEPYWTRFLTKNLHANLPAKKGAPKGTYQVIIRFIIGIDGSIESTEPETKFGFAMEEEAIRVIKQSPPWTPAIMYGKPVKAYRRQPITFLVEEE